MQNAGAKHNNDLIHETSPYLLQHAHNPVNWTVWGEKALQKAKAENKLILISVGYSACHWCHVMEHECFENEQLARIMNDNFVCIKVDREERPDLDNVYMTAVQLMTGRGGWPLNCFTLPDGRPIYGGTYFPAQQWQNILINLIDGYSTEPEKFVDYAEKLMEGIRLSDVIENKKEEDLLSKEEFEKAIQNFKNDWDLIDGGFSRVPKFPLPNSYEFLLRYYVSNKSKEVLDFISFTLTKIAQGGIYDQIGGGFSRYSVDGYWKVPHFEKMLYDNAQLISLYSETYQVTKDPFFKQVVEQSIEFLMRDMHDEQGYFYSALDADSEGVEGKFYVWTESQIAELFPEDKDLVNELFCIGKEGLWEHGNSIPLLNKNLQELKTKYNLSEVDFDLKYNSIRNKLLDIRNRRVWPGRDEKVITSWNAITANALLDAAIALDDNSYLLSAEKCLNFLLTKCRKDDYGLYHSLKNNGEHVNGFLEDYALLIQALIKAYEVAGNDRYIKEAKQLLEYVFEKFADKNSGMFYYTSIDDDPLIARKIEFMDNVISASNSVMANNLFLMGKILADQTWIDHSKGMLKNVQEQIAGYVSGYANWCVNYLYHTNNFYEVVVNGENAKLVADKILKSGFLPFKVVLHSSDPNEEMELFKGRFVEGKILIYVCSNNTCLLPTENLEDAISKML